VIPARTQARSDALAAPLRRGDHGPRVVALRSLLARAEADPAPSDPLPSDPLLSDPAPSDPAPSDLEAFDARLEHAVRAFQQRRGLVADGVVGHQTARVLDSARWRLGDRILLFTPGHLMRGDDVAALQERLVVLGIHAGPVDAVFGTATESALRELQRGLGLEPDGLCGPATLRAIGSLARAVGGGDPWALRQQADVAVAGPSLAGKVVVIDPAGGAGSPGPTAAGLSEADIALDLAYRIEGRLAATGVTVVLTRGAATCPDDAARASLARSVRADLFLSLHCEWHTGPQASGVATFFWGDDRVGARSATGEALAGRIQREVVARTGLGDLRTHPCTVEIVRITRMPAVLVELGYLSNPGDAARLSDPAFRDVVAEGLVVAIQRLYLGDDDAVTGSLQLADVLAHAGRN
jgi:N-acetylmuramoyl-L-alanine amidase